MVAVCNDGSLLVVGGYDAHVHYLASVERLLPGPEQPFNQAADVHNGRFCHGMCALKDGRVFVCGGYGAYCSAELYSPKKNLWTRLPDMPTGRSLPTTCSLFDKEGKEFVLVFGVRSFEEDPHRKPYRLDCILD